MSSTAFQQASKIEDIARAEIMPWLLLKCESIEEIPPGLFLQKIAGDFIVVQQAKRYSIELKAEARFTQNLFLETWSNLPELNPGWMVTSRARYLFYFFTDVKTLYIIGLPELQTWAFGGDGRPGAIYQYPEKSQTKYSQLNFTTGRIVPLLDIEAAKIPFKRISLDRKS